MNAYQLDLQEEYLPNLTPEQVMDAVIEFYGFDVIAEIIGRRNSAGYET